MAKLIVAVIAQPDLATDVMSAWTRAGVKSATLLPSSGMERMRRAGLLRDDMPLMLSLAAVEASQEVASSTIFAVVADDLDVDAIVAATESAVGKLGGADTGILFVLPVVRVVGGQV